MRGTDTCRPSSMFYIQRETCIPSTGQQGATPLTVKLQRTSADLSSVNLRSDWRKHFGNFAPVSQKDWAFFGEGGTLLMTSLHHMPESCPLLYTQTLAPYILFQNIIKLHSAPDMKAFTWSSTLRRRPERRAPVYSSISNEYEFRKRSQCSCWSLQIQI